MEEFTKETGVDGRIILRHILEKYYRRTWNGLFWHRIGTSGWLL
jgi:hypothetical protein